MAKELYQLLGNASELKALCMARACSSFAEHELRKMKQAKKVAAVMEMTCQSGSLMAARAPGPVLSCHMGR